MNKELLKQINPTESIINALPAIIEAFVTFYGESERENITNKFENMIVIGYMKPENVSRIIGKIKKEKSKELTKEFLEKLSKDNEEQEKLSKLFLNNADFDYSDMQPINLYINYRNGKRRALYWQRQVVEFLKQTHPETTIENVDELIESNTYKSIETIIPIYEEILKKYNELLNELKPYNEYIEKCKDLKKTLEKKYLQKTVETLKDLFTKEELKQIEEEFDNKFYYSIKNVNGKTKNYFGINLNSTKLIEAFSEESNQILLTGEKWRQDSIKKDRIQYFKNLGLDLGNDYETYLNVPRINNFLPSTQTVERILNTNNNMYTEMMNEYYKSIPEYQKNRARIEELNLIDKSDSYNASAYENRKTAVNPNLKQIDGKYIQYPLLLFNMEGLEEWYDKTLVHELNHVYELQLQNATENSYQMTCGWEILEDEINHKEKQQVSLKDREEKRNYELFNEIINELIAQEISEILSQSNIYIFNNKENKKIAGGTGYERTKFLVKEFYETYKKEIIESRKNGNLSIIFETVGKENFESLNQLFHEFHENFKEFEYYRVINDLTKKVENEKTNKLKEIHLKKKKILEQMEEYNQKKISRL